MIFERYFFLPDIHFPYQDNKALKAAFYFLKDFAPDVVVQLGDLLDCYALSTFSKDASRLLSFENELELGKNFWKKVRQLCPNSDLYMLEGNHEERLQKTLNSKVPELSDLKALKLEKLLDLGEYKVTFKRRHERLTFHDIFDCSHGFSVAAKSGMTAHKELDKRMISGISGHTHRAGKIFVSKNNKDYFWVESGFLGSTKAGFEFMGAIPPDWQKAVSVGYMWQFQGEWNVKIDLVEADKYGNFFYDGKLYTENGIL